MRKSSKHSRHVSLLSAFCCDKRKCASRVMDGTFWLQHKPTRLLPALGSCHIKRYFLSLPHFLVPFLFPSFSPLPLSLLHSSSPFPFHFLLLSLSFPLALSFSPPLSPSFIFPPKSSQKVWGSAVSSPAGSGAENWIDVNCNCTNAQL